MGQLRWHHNHMQPTKGPSKLLNWECGGDANLSHRSSSSDRKKKKKKPSLFHALPTSHIPHQAVSQPRYNCETIPRPACFVAWIALHMVQLLAFCSSSLIQRQIITSTEIAKPFFNQHGDCPPLAVITDAEVTISFYLGYYGGC